MPFRKSANVKNSLDPLNIQAAKIQYELQVIINIALMKFITPNTIACSELVEKCLDDLQKYHWTLIGQKALGYKDGLPISESILKDRMNTLQSMIAKLAEVQKSRNDLDLLKFYIEVLPSIKYGYIRKSNLKALVEGRLIKAITKPEEYNLDETQMMDLGKYLIANGANHASRVHELLGSGYTEEISPSIKNTLNNLMSRAAQAGASSSAIQAGVAHVSFQIGGSPTPVAIAPSPALLFGYVQPSAPLPPSNNSIAPGSNAAVADAPIAGVTSVANPNVKAASNSDLASIPLDGPAVSLHAHCGQKPNI